MNKSPGTGGTRVFKTVRAVGRRYPDRGEDNCEVTVEIDLDWLVGQLAYRARWNKAKRTRALNGAVVITVKELDHD